MSIKTITADELRRMIDKEGLILQGCGGDLNEWVDGINEMLTEDGILQKKTKFNPDNVRTFEHNNSTCLLFPFDDSVKLSMSQLAMWRLKTHEQFYGTWLSDFVVNSLGGFTHDEPAKNEKPDCCLIGEDSNIFHLMGVASRTLKDNDIPAELTYVRVITTTTASGVDKNDLQPDEDGNYELPTTVTLLVNKEQAKLLANYESDGNMHISLVFRGDEDAANKYLEAQEKVFAKSEVE